jgi:hypothetical protein
MSSDSESGGNAEAGAHTDASEEDASSDGSTGIGFFGDSGGQKDDPWLLPSGGGGGTGSGGGAGPANFSPAAVVFRSLHSPIGNRGAPVPSLHPRP